MKKLLHEPLVYFLLMGALVFALVSATGDDQALPRDNEVIVTAGHIENLATTFTRTWQRPPTTDELKGLIDAYIEEEILSREAMRIGLDRNDTVIRRRLKQKMEFLYEDFAATATPTDDELRRHYEENADAYRADPRLTFRHVFLSDDRGDAIAADAIALLSDLRDTEAPADPESAGDPTLLPYELNDAPLRDIVGQFGSEFADRLDEVGDIGEWRGPIRSAYGLHLVLVTDRIDGQLPPLERVRAAVERDLMAERRQSTHQAMLDALLQRYDITIEWPDTDAPAAAATPSDER